MSKSNNNNQKIIMSKSNHNNKKIKKKGKNTIKIPIKKKLSHPSFQCPIDIFVEILEHKNYYENSFYSIKEIPFAFRFAILVARRVYRKIGYKILNKKNLENYKKSGKIYVSNFEKIIETLLSIFDLIKLSLISKNDDNIEHDHDSINEEINLNERI